MKWPGLNAPARLRLLHPKYPEVFCTLSSKNRTVGWFDQSHMPWKYYAECRTSHECTRRFLEKKEGGGGKLDRKRRQDGALEGRQAKKPKLSFVHMYTPSTYPAQGAYMPSQEPTNPPHDPNAPCYLTQRHHFHNFYSSAEQPQTQPDEHTRTFLQAYHYTSYSMFNCRLPPAPKTAPSTPRFSQPRPSSRSSADRPYIAQPQAVPIRDLIDTRGLLDTFGDASTPSPSTSRPRTRPPSPGTRSRPPSSARTRPPSSARTRPPSARTSTPSPDPRTSSCSMSATGASTLNRTSSLCKPSSPTRASQNPSLSEARAPDTEKPTPDTEKPAPDSDAYFETSVIRSESSISPHSGAYTQVCASSTTGETVSASEPAILSASPAPLASPPLHASPALRASSAPRASPAPGASPTPGASPAPLASPAPHASPPLHASFVATTEERHRSPIIADDLDLRVVLEDALDWIQSLRIPTPEITTCRMQDTILRKAMETQSPGSMSTISSSGSTLTMSEFFCSTLTPSGVTSFGSASSSEMICDQLSPRSVVSGALPVYKTPQQILDDYSEHGQREYSGREKYEDHQQQQHLSSYASFGERFPVDGRSVGHGLEETMEASGIPSVTIDKADAHVTKAHPPNTAGEYASWIPSPVIWESSNDRQVWDTIGVRRTRDSCDEVSSGPPGANVGVPGAHVGVPGAYVADAHLPNAADAHASWAPSPVIWDFGNGRQVWDSNGGRRMRESDHGRQSTAHSKEYHLPGAPVAHFDPSSFVQLQPTSFRDNLKAHLYRQQASYERQTQQPLTPTFPDDVQMHPPRALSLPAPQLYLPYGYGRHWAASMAQTVPRLPRANSTSSQAISASSQAISASSQVIPPSLYPYVKDAAAVGAL